MKQGLRIDCKGSITALDLLLPFSKDVVYENLPVLNEAAWQMRTAFLSEHGIRMLRSGDTLHVRGTLKSGSYHFGRSFCIRLASAVMIALAQCDGVSMITADSDAVNMQSYLAMTADIMRKFGVQVPASAAGYIVYGNQNYTSPKQYAVEADWDTAAMWLAAKHAGADIDLENLPERSHQCARRILSLLPHIGNRIEIGTQFNLLPALCTAAALSPVRTQICGSFSQDDPRIDAVYHTLRAMGIICSAEDGCMTVCGGDVHGADIDCEGDSRLAMMTALCATFSQEPITIRNAESVLKSDPSFYRRLQMLGADIQIEQ